MSFPEKAVVLGAGGFVGRELIRLIALHPNLKVEAALSKSQAGNSIGEIYPEVQGFLGGSFLSPDRFEWSQLSRDKWILFSALSHGETMQVLPSILEEIGGNDAMVIDLSGDFRLECRETYQRYYGIKHTRSDWLEKFVYGLPEFNRKKIQGSRFVSNPGCFATAAQLALLPLVDLEKEPLFVAIDAKTGSSGAGIQPRLTTHHPLRANDFRAYKPLEHQHLPEIEQMWNQLGGSSLTNISFVSQMAPLVRGIFVSTHVFFSEPPSEDQLVKCFQDAYAESPFVRLVPESPSLTEVWGTNRCDLSIHVREGKVLICSAIDNLIKGAAGQAIQNSNLMAGWPEISGLQVPPPRPV